eukprot:ANDGO_03204.mRNA.1 hypothetical protein SARC_12846
MHCNMRFIVALDGLIPLEDVMSQVKSNWAKTAHAEVTGTVEEARILLRPEDLTSDHTADSVRGPSGTTSDVACIMFTSGSTGVPKGAVLEHKGLIHCALGHI